MHVYDEVYIEANENYIKQTARNRTQIYSANGILNLSIPIKKNSGKKIAIKNAEISFVENWNKIHWQAIVSAYNSSPFFEFYADDFEPAFNNPPEKLWDFNVILNEILIDLLNIETHLLYTEEYIPPNGDNNIIDLRYEEKQTIDFPPYYQVFDDKYDFIPNLSIIDLLFNLGPESILYLDNIALDRECS